MLPEQHLLHVMGSSASSECLGATWSMLSIARTHAQRSDYTCVGAKAWQSNCG